MFNRSIAFFIATATLCASGPMARANLIGMPLNLGSSIDTGMKIYIPAQPISALVGSADGCSSSFAPRSDATR